LVDAAFVLSSAESALSLTMTRAVSAAGGDCAIAYIDASREAHSASKVKTVRIGGAPLGDDPGM
jgi:hypothetical protein